MWRVYVLLESGGDGVWAFERQAKRSTHRTISTIVSATPLGILKETAEQFPPVLVEEVGTPVVFVPTKTVILSQYMIFP